MPYGKSVTCALFAAAALLVPTLPVSAAEFDINASVARVLELTNLERQNAGVPPLTLSSELTAAAQGYSQVLAESGCFAHTCGPVPRFTDRIGLAGYTGFAAVAENIAAGFPTPESVVDGWMGSEGHRANLLSPKYSEIGIGVATGAGPYGTFWTQDFGSRRFAPPPPASEPAAAPPDPASDDVPEGD
jgi:uncharacterized protein YkwD